MAPPPEPLRRRWAWRSAGGALITGGLLTAAGGALRWWGPERLPDITARENGDANPLQVGWTAHVHPGSGELVASGQLLVVLALLLMLLLPWRGLASRLLASVALLSGVAALVLQPVLWMLWWAQGRPAPDAPGWSADVPGAVYEVVGIVGSPWILGVGPLLLAAAVLTSVSGAPMPAHWRRTLAACVPLAFTAYVVEYFTGMIVFLSDSHDDPVGTHVVSGLGGAVAGALLLTAARTHAETPGTTRAAGLVVPTRLRRWVAAGLLLALAGVVGATSTLLFRPQGLMTGETTPAVVGVVELIPRALLVLTYATLALGPFRGGRRAMVVGLTLVAAVPLVVGTLGSGPTWTVEPSGLQSVAAMVETVVVTGVSFLVLAVVLLWEQAHTRPLTRRGLVTLVVAAVVAAVANVTLPSILSGLDTAGAQEWGMTWQAMLPSLAGMIVGVVLVAASADALEHHRRPVTGA